MAGWVTSVVLAYVTCVYLLAIDFASLLRKTGSGSFTKAAVKELYYEFDVIVSIFVMITLTLCVRPAFCIVFLPS